MTDVAFYTLIFPTNCHHYRPIPVQVKQNRKENFYFSISKECLLDPSDGRFFVLSDKFFDAFDPKDLDAAIGRKVIQAVEKVRISGEIK